MAPSPPGTVELVERVLAGGPTADEAWSVLVDGHLRLVWKVVRSFGLTPADQQDAYQAAWLRAVEKLHTLREPERFPGWLATVTANEVRALLRGRRLTTPLDEAPETVLATTPSLDAVDGADRAVAVRAGLAHLDDRCRQLLRLLTAEPPLSYAEVGEVMDMPHGAIGPTRQRCLEKLRRTPEVAALIASEA